MRAGSKILPQVAHLIAHGSVGEFEIVESHGFYLSDLTLIGFLNH